MTTKSMNRIERAARDSGESRRRIDLASARSAKAMSSGLLALAGAAIGTVLGAQRRKQRTRETIEALGAVEAAKRLQTDIDRWELGLVPRHHTVGQMREHFAHIND